MNSINPGNLPPVTPAKPEAANSQTVNTGSSEVHQNANRRTSASSPAALVNLDKFITTELDKLGQTIVRRSVIVDAMPPQVKELVQNILKQTQSTQTVLPQGLAALLKSPQTAAEKLLLLAAALEAEASSSSEQQVKAATTAAGKPQTTAELPAGASPLLPSKSPTPAVHYANPGPSQTQDLTSLIKAALAQPELIESLPPEIKKLIQSLELPEETALPSQPGQTVAHSPTEAPSPFVRQLPTASEKLLQLASALEQATEPAIAESAPAEGRTPSTTNAGVQPDLAETVRLLRSKNPEGVKATAGMIRELAESMPRAGGVLAEQQDNQRVFSFTTLLYSDDGKTAYPAHIHLFHQKEEDKKNPGQTVTETWLRVCLETENLGLVDTLFRLHDRDTVDIKVQFNDQSVAAAFATGVNEVKDKLRELPLKLGEFLVK